MKKTGTKEWADRNVNIQTGCPYDCRYCYAKEMAIRFKRATAASWKTPCNVGTKVLPSKRVPGVTMFPTAHDITPSNANECAMQIRWILNTGDSVLLVTKGDPQAVQSALLPARRLVPKFEERIEIRVTLGSMDDNVLRLWEPGAPRAEQRLETLRWLHQSGFNTSVSMEPMLDPFPGAVLAAVAPYIRPETGTVWIGIGRELVKRVRVNNPGNEAIVRCAENLRDHWDEYRLRKLYETWKDHSWIRWKDSIREVLKLKGDGQ